MNLEQIRRIRLHLDEALKEMNAVEAAASTELPLRSMLKNALEEIKMQDALSMTMKEASRRTGISVQALHRYEKAGKLKTRKPAGGARIVLRDDLLIFLRELDTK